MPEFARTLGNRAGLGQPAQMAESITVSQLSNRYARLLGAYRAADRFIEDVIGLAAIREATEQIEDIKLELKSQMAEIAGSIRQFDPKFIISSIRPIRPKNQQYKNGTISKLVYAALREQARPLRTREIVRLVVEKLGLPLEEKFLIRFDTLVYNALTPRIGFTIQVEGDPKQWSLIPADQVRARNG